MDISKVSTAPWKIVDKKGWSGIETSDGQDLLLYATCEGNWHGRICFNKMEDAEFIALARNAFDVMMRRGWNPFVDYSKDGDLLWFCMCDARIPEEVTGPYDNPFTALIECDKWYKENVDKK